jgi:hypothetical protein
MRIPTEKHEVKIEVLKIPPDEPPRTSLPIGSSVLRERDGVRLASHDPALAQQVDTVPAK